MKREVNGTCKFFGGGVRSSNAPSIAVAQTHHPFERLDVNIARSILDRLNDDQIGQLDDGRFLGSDGKTIEVNFLLHFLDRFDIVRVRLVLGLFLRIEDDLLHRPGLAAFEIGAASQ